ncbi:uncharacterized protein [Panulirus ornatus]|uniref:uncharacterized protein n=1 Tax=Panulirus ornatus TaxID=150431 RepID=UPI003A8A84F3
MGYVMKAEVAVNLPDEGPFEGSEEGVHLFSGEVDPITESASGVLYNPQTPPTVTLVENPNLDFIGTWIGLGMSVFLMMIGTGCFIIALEGCTVFQNARGVWLQSSVRRWLSYVFPRWFPHIEEPAVQAVLNLQDLSPQDEHQAVHIGPHNPNPNDPTDSVRHGVRTLDPEGLSSVDPPAVPEAVSADDKQNAGGS